jgi:GH18 family chitinase
VFLPSQSLRHSTHKLFRWHPTRPTNAADREGIDHVVLAFAAANATATFQPKTPISTIRTEFPNAKVMIAIGGWGDTVGFTEATKTDAGIAKFASDVQTMLTNTGADGIGMSGFISPPISFFLFLDSNTGRVWC